MSRNLYFVAAYDPFVATCDLSGVRKLVKEPTGARERRRKVLELLNISQSSATCLRQV